MQRCNILAIFYFLLVSSCGFKSYNNPQVENIVREYVRDSKIDITLIENHDRKVKQELLEMMFVSGSFNRDENKRFIIRLSTDYSNLIGVQDPTGAVLAYTTNLRICYSIFDTSSKNKKTVDMSGVDEDRGSIWDIDIPQNPMLIEEKSSKSSINSNNRANAILSSQYELIDSGVVSVSSNYVASQSILYSGYVSETYQLELLAIEGTQRLFHKLIDAFTKFSETKKEVAKEDSRKVDMVIPN